MKTRTLVMAGVVALAIMSSTRVAQAQENMKVTIPFDFVAGNRSLPAGEYSVNVSGQTHMLILVDRKDGAPTILGAHDVVAREPQSQSKLIFNRYGDRYFLSQVWMQGNSRGRQLSKSAREKEIVQVAQVDTRNRVTLVAELLRTT
ncbi:MAG: hypothetical protein WBE12_20995, partial [Candidatus Acidiferrum sp.]